VDDIFSHADRLKYGRTEADRRFAVRERHPTTMTMTASKSSRTRNLQIFKCSKPANDRARGGQKAQLSPAEKCLNGEPSIPNARNARRSIFSMTTSDLFR
jgi:hypothetical protein